MCVWYSLSRGVQKGKLDSRSTALHKRPREREIRRRIRRAARTACDKKKKKRVFFLRWKKPRRRTRSDSCAPRMRKRRAHSGGPTRPSRGGGRVTGIRVNASVRDYQRARKKKKEERKKRESPVRYRRRKATIVSGRIPGPKIRVTEPSDSSAYYHGARSIPGKVISWRDCAPPAIKRIARCTQRTANYVDSNGRMGPRAQSDTQGPRSYRCPPCPSRGPSARRLSQRALGTPRDSPEMCNTN